MPTNTCQEKTVVPTTNNHCVKFKDQSVRRWYDILNQGKQIHLHVWNSPCYSLDVANDNGKIYNNNRNKSSIFVIAIFSFTHLDIYTSLACKLISHTILLKNICFFIMIRYTKTNVFIQIYIQIFQISECANPPNVLNATLELLIDTNSIIFYYKCEEGTNLIGNSSIVCLSSTNWTVPLFTCSGMILF